MNQTQRDFLIGKVRSTCREQTEKLKGGIPVKPSLNNYLIASFLDNSIQFQDINQLKVRMRETVLKMGHGDALIVEGDSWNPRRRKDNEDPQFVQIPPEDLFIIPQNYLDALAEYEKLKTELEKKIEQLDATAETIILKLQIGSSKALDHFVEQVDNIADLDLMSNQLLLKEKE